MQQFTRGYEVWNTLKRSLSLPYSFRVEQWIDRSDTGKMVCYFGVAISIQVGSNFKFEFVFYEKLYIYMCVILWSLMIFDDASQPRTFQSLRCPVLAKRPFRLDEIGWSADRSKDQLYPIGIPRIWGWSISLMLNEGKVWKSQGSTPFIYVGLWPF